MLQYYAAIMKNNKDLDDYIFGPFASLEEAEAAGEAAVLEYDPEYQKRCPGTISFYTWEDDLSSSPER